MERRAYWVGRGLSPRWQDAGNWAGSSGGRAGHPWPRGATVGVIDENSGDGTVDLFRCPCRLEVRGFKGRLILPQGGEFDLRPRREARWWSQLRLSAFAARAARRMLLRVPLRLPRLPTLPMPRVPVEVLAAARMALGSVPRLRAPPVPRVSRMVGPERWPVAVRTGVAVLVIQAAALFVVPAALGAATTYFWIGGTGTWDNAATTHWSLTTGPGTPGAGPPTSADPVVFDANSGLNAGGTVTIASTAVCGGCSISGITSNNVVFSLSGNPTWSAGTYTFAGSSQPTPILFASNTMNVTRTLTINGTYSGNTDVHFRDITIAGSGGSLSGTRIGDALGNSGITFAASTSLTWQGTAGGNWSDITKWGARVPLPQDDVSFGNAFAATQTITVDMRRIGRSINFTGTTGNPALSFSSTVDLYGSLNLSGITGLSSGQPINFSGRSAGLTINPNGNTFRTTINGPGGTYALTGALNTGGNAFLVAFGTFDAAGFNVTTDDFVQASNTTTIAGSGTWTLTGTGTVWNMNVTSTTYTGGSETIVISNTTATAKTFAGAGKSYGTVRHISTGSGGLTITGSNTFVNLDLEATTARTVTLTASTTQTVTGLLTLSGASGQLLSLVSSSPGTSASISLPLGAAASINGFVSLSADILLDRVVGLTTGGNWNATTTWAKGVVPTSASDVLLGGSGTFTLNANASARSLGTTGFTGTLTHNAGVTLSIGDGTAGAGNLGLRLVSGMTYTLGNATTSAINFVNGPSGTPQIVDTNGKTLGNVTFTAGSWQFTSAFTAGAATTTTHTAGTLNFNGQTVSLGDFDTSNANVRTLTLGSSAVTASGSFTAVTSTNLTVTANTATVTMTSAAPRFRAGAVDWGGVSVVYSNITGTAQVDAAVGWKNFTATGGATKLAALQINADLTISGTLTFGGNTVRGVNRLAFVGNITAATRTITAAAYVVTGDTDFQDIDLEYSGSASWTNSGNSYIGDFAGGNAGAVTTNLTAAAAQSWVGTAGGNWSDVTKWTSRVPLPQDNVTINVAFAATQTVTADMPRLGRSINWTGSTGSPTWSRTTPNFVCGDLTLIPGLTVSGSQPLTLCGRSAFVFKSASKDIATAGNLLSLQPAGGSYTLTDPVVITGNFQLTDGTLNANGQNVTANSFICNSGRTRVLNMGTGTWTVTGSGGTTWNISAAGLTLNPSTSTINMAPASGTATFAGGSQTYATLTSTTAGNVTVTGDNGFSAITLSATTAWTLTLPANGRQTVSGNISITGASGQLISLVSSTGGQTSFIDVAGNATRSFWSQTDVVINFTRAPASADTATTHSDTVARKVVDSRDSVDTATTFSESPARTASKARSLTDTGATFSESLARIASKQRADADDAMTFTETAGSFKTVSRAPTDTAVTQTDSSDRTLSKARTLTDTGMTFGSTSSRLFQTTRALNDDATPAFSESVNRSAGHFARTAFDDGDGVIFFNDFVRRSNGVFARTAADTAVTQSESPARNLTKGRAAADTGVTFSDSVTTRTAVKFRSTADLAVDTGAPNFDVPTRQEFQGRALADTAVTQTDSVAQQRFKGRAVADTGVTFSDTAARTRFLVRVTPPDGETGVNQSDTVSITIGRFLTDTAMTFAGSVTRQLTKLRLPADTATTFSDTAGGPSARARTTTDTATSFSDTVARTMTETRSVSDGWTTTDTAYSTKYRNLADTGAAFSDTAVRAAANKQRATSDSFPFVGDSADRTARPLRLPVDTMFVSDGVGRAEVEFRAITDTGAAFSDSAARAPANKQRATSDDLFPMLDSATRAELALRLVSDTMLVSDGAGRGAIEFRAATDTFTVGDGGVVRVKLAVERPADTAMTFSDSLFVRDPDRYLMTDSVTAYVRPVLTGPLTVKLVRDTARVVVAP